MRWQGYTSLKAFEVHLAKVAKWLQVQLPSVIQGAIKQYNECGVKVVWTLFEMYSNETIFRIICFHLFLFSSITRRLWARHWWCTKPSRWRLLSGVVQWTTRLRKGWLPEKRLYVLPSIYHQWWSRGMRPWRRSSWPLHSRWARRRWSGACFDFPIASGYPRSLMTPRLCLRPLVNSH